MPKKKRDNGILCFFVGKGNFLKEAFLSPHPYLSRTLQLGAYFFTIISALNARTTYVRTAYERLLLEEKLARYATDEV